MIGKFKMAALIGAAVAFVGHWVLHFAVAGALFAAIGLSGGGHSPVEAGPDCSNGQTIYAKALTDHGCDSGEWHFVINQVRLGQAYAPVGITVSWANGQTLYVPLEKFTGKVAHYTTTYSLDSTVVSATAEIYKAWGGQFNLSHGPCGFTTPAPTPTSVPTPTPPPGTPTPTPTPTVVPSPTPTPPLNPTPAPDGTVTPVGTSISQGPVPVGFPDTGGVPAVESCDSSNTVLQDFLIVGGIIVASVVVLLGGLCLLFGRR